jgi:hypothetical protein
VDETELKINAEGWANLWWQDGDSVFGEVFTLPPLNIARDVIGIKGQGEGPQIDFEECLGPYPLASGYKLLIMSTEDVDYRYICHYSFNEERNTHFATLRRLKKRTKVLYPSGNS